MYKEILDMKSHAALKFRDMTNRAVRVVPAILTDKSDCLETMVRQAETFTDYVQVDIMDGRFVPSHSITSQDLSGLNINLTWEAHLMVKQPEDCLVDFWRAGAKKAIFHYEATTSPERVISLGRNIGLKMGLAVNPETKVRDFLPLADKVDSVLFLSVHPGFYGAKFIPETLDKIVEFRRLQPDIEIGIDGGIKEGNISQVARSGVDVIYAGSAIFLSQQPGESFCYLNALANRGR